VSSGAFLCFTFGFVFLGGFFDTFVCDLGAGLVLFGLDVARVERVADNVRERIAKAADALRV
jgi:hypothetical protein